MYMYPQIRRICTADLHGYLVNVPCNAELVVKAEYGSEQWAEPKQSWHWISSPYNVAMIGKWTPNEWDGGEVYEKHD